MDKEMKNRKNIRKLSIFDFDGTLISTPMPDMGRIIYKQKTGNVWPYEGWWGHASSLDMDIFDMQTNKDVIDDYKIDRDNPANIIVMLTGRLVKLDKEVKAILDYNGLVFDEYHYNNGGSTEVSKKRTMEALLEKYPEVEEIQLWDDRLEFVPIFEEWGKNQCLSGRLKYFSITLVASSNYQL